MNYITDFFSAYLVLISSFNKSNVKTSGSGLKKLMMKSGIDLWFDPSFHRRLTQREKFSRVVSSHFFSIALRSLLQRLVSLHLWSCKVTKVWQIIELLKNTYIALQKAPFFGHLWSKMGSIQIEIKYLKRAGRILIFRLQIDVNQIFQMRYYKTLNDNL